MAAIAGAAIAGGVALLGDSMSASGQQATNAQMTANMLQQEQWQENMADTAMQRRVTDLQAAGLNPMLAVNSNGAQVNSVGQPSLQNPDASYGQLGQQAQGAIASGVQASQIAVNSAQADKLSADAKLSNAQATRAGQAPAEMGQLDLLMARNGLSMSNMKMDDLVNAMQAGGPETAGVQVLKQQIDNLKAQNPGIKADSFVSEQDARVKGALVDAMIRSSAAELAAAGSSAQALDRFNNSKFGQFWNSVTGGTQSASPSGVLGAAAHAAGQVIKGPTRVFNIKP